MQCTAERRPCIYATFLNIIFPVHIQHTSTSRSSAYTCMRSACTHSSCMHYPSQKGAEHILSMSWRSPQRDALQFEWAWQHPTVSLAVRDMAGTLPKRALAGVKGKVSGDVPRKYDNIQIRHF